MSRGGRDVLLQGVSRKGWGWLRECSSGEGSFAVRWAYFMGDGGGYADAVRDRNPSPTGGTTFR